MIRRRQPGPLSSLALSLEQLEARRVLSASSFATNDCAPDLDVAALAANTDLLTVRAGQTLSFNLYDQGVTFSDTQDGGTTTNQEAGNLFLKHDAIPAGASLTRQGDFTFTPGAALVGTQTFTLIGVDRQGPALADSELFSITVRPANEQPSFDIESDPPSVNEDSGDASVSAFATNISPGQDEEDQRAGLMFIVTANSNPALFAAAPAINPATGELTYRPADDANGSAEITVLLMDQGGVSEGGIDKSAPQTFTITVDADNDGPMLSAPTVVAATEDEATAISDVMVADIDVDETPGGQVMVTVAVENGTATLTTLTGLDFSSAGGGQGDGTSDAIMAFRGSLADVNAALATLQYQAGLNFNGPDTVDITVNDLGNTGTGNALEDSKTIDVNVAAVNDAPVLSVTSQIQTVLNDEGASLTAMSVADVDAGSDDLTATLVVDSGMLAIDPAVLGLESIAGDGTSGDPLTFTGQLDAINAALANIKYAPANAFVGTATVTATVNDQGATGAGGANTDTQTVALDVIADTNSFPTISPVPQPLEAETLAQFSLTLTATDPDVDDTLTFSVDTDFSPEGVRVGPTTENPDGSFSAELTWTPAADQTGLQPIRVQVTDDGLGGLLPKPHEQTFVVEVIQVFRVNTTEDTVDADLADGVAEDADGNTSLRAAIQQANASPGRAKIVLPEGRYALSIPGPASDDASGDLNITGELVIEGAGAATTIIDAGGAAGLGDRVFFVESGVDVHLVDLAIFGGHTTGVGGGIFNAGNLVLTRTIVSGNSTEGNDADGGGIFLDGGQLSVFDSTISGNSTTGDAADGGGIFNNSGHVSITNSTLSGNSTSGAGAHGGGIYSVTNLNDRATSILNSTISGNWVTDGLGGGLFNFDGLTVIQLSTITDNSAPVDNGSGIASYGDNSTITNVQGTIVAGNTDEDVAVVAGEINSFQSGDFNLIGQGNNFGAGQNALDNFNAANDQTDVADPLVGPLQNNGGATQTHALLTDSPAIDAGDFAFDGTAFDPEINADQRGAARIRGTVIDVGAFESDFTVNRETDAFDAVVGDGIVDVGDGNRTLRAAIEEANATAGHNTIVLGSGEFIVGLRGTDDVAKFGDLDITDDLTIIGAGADQTMVRAINDGANSIDDRVFHVLGGANVHFVGITITGGNLADASGGGLWIEDGDVTLSEVEVVGNQTTGQSTGGGIAVNRDAALVIERSTIADNESVRGGGGILNFRGDVSITNSTISGNRNTDPSQPGGGISTNAGSFRLTSSTVTRNAAGGSGGGVASVDGAPEIRNSIIAGNLSTTGANNVDVYSVFEGHFASLGNNLIGNIGANLDFENGVNQDRVGTNAAPIDPVLGDLADNGGPTRTHALLFDSPALDAGSSLGALPFDQRGQPRTTDLDEAPFPNAGNGTDIGAYEASPAPPSADFDVDEVTNGRDFLLWQRGFSAPMAEKGDGDADNDGDVDDVDLGFWHAEFGKNIVFAAPNLQSGIDDPSEIALAASPSVDVQYLAPIDDAFAALAENRVGPAELPTELVQELVELRSNGYRAPQPLDHWLDGWSIRPELT